MDVPTANWFHKVDGIVGLVVHRHQLDPPDDELVRDLNEIISEARRFAKTVGDRYVGGSHDPATSSAASQPMTEADVLELARSLEGASEKWVCFLDGSYGDRCRRPEDIDRNDPLDTQWHGNCGRFLVIPLPREEK
jgi:hypothetical protein